MEKSPFTEEDVEDVWKELVDDAIWEFCFDVHRTVKMNRLLMDAKQKANEAKEKKKKEEAENDVPGQISQSKKNTFVSCPNCNSAKTEGSFGTFLPKSLHDDERARKKKEEAQGVASESSDNSIGEDAKESSNKKTEKSIASGGPSDSATENYDFKNMTSEEEAAFLKEKRDVTKENEICLNSDECVNLTNEERGLIWQYYLKNSEMDATLEQMKRRSHDNTE